jgi:CubicO group peptidase (beta-lactamase class C family)
MGIRRGLSILAILVSMTDWSLSQQYIPGDTWRESLPEEQGVDSRSLVEMLKFIRRGQIPVHSIVVVRHGYIVLDVSFYPYNPDWPHDMASATKSVTSLLTGIAIDQGVIDSTQQTVRSLLPQYAKAFDSPARQKLTVQNLLTMTSGFNCNVDDGEMALRQMQESDDWAAFTLRLPIVSEPGSKFAYCSPNCHLLSVILSARTKQSEADFAKQNLFRPLRINEARWGSDPQGRTTGWGGLHLKPRDMARLGYLYLHDGSWGGRQIVSSAWVRSSIEPKVAVKPGVAYGYNWWINTAHTPPIFEAEGRGGQRITVIRDKDAVIAFTGGGDNTDEFAPFLLRSLESDGKLAKNPRANKQLQSLVRLAKQAPPPRSASQLPTKTYNISEKTLIFERNPLRLEAMTFHFAHGKDPRITLRLADETYDAPIGTDNRPALSLSGPFGLPFATQCKWDANGHLVLDLDTVANINHYTIEMDLNVASPSAKINEVTGELKDYVVKAHF